ncbi:MAG: AAA-like domain-containing protein [Thainema sp.]
MDSQPAIATNGMNQPRYAYQVGGSLSCDDPCYVVRRADTELYHALRQGQFCYVFNSRQMGKSSLRVRVRHRLQQSGYCCAAIDLTQLGSQNLTPEQWYRGLISELWRTLGLMGRVNLRAWLREQADLSAVQQLSHFIETVILAYIPANLVIFIDEIDSVLGLDFSVDDFFAWIRYCYNQRAEQPDYRRLTFALFGVTTPSDLIQDHSRTPFNIGRAIALTGFQPDEVKPLTYGLAGIVPTPHLALKEILKWTGGQPFLTQKLCQCMVEQHQAQVRSLPISRHPATASKSQPPNPFLDQLVQEALAHHSDIAVQVDTVVQSRIVANWEMQDNPEHLRTIRNRLLHRSPHTQLLLDLYEQIWLQGDVSTDQYPIQIELQLELMLTGLVEKHDSRLRLRNQIYRAVFDQAWIEQERNKLPALTTSESQAGGKSAIAPIAPLQTLHSSPPPPSSPHSLSQSQHLQLVPEPNQAEPLCPNDSNSIGQTVIQQINALDIDAVEAIARSIAQHSPQKAQALLRGLTTDNHQNPPKQR